MTFCHTHWDKQYTTNEIIICTNNNLIYTWFLLSMKIPINWHHIMYCLLHHFYTATTLMCPGLSKLC